jgi:hypothetical protein
MRAAGLEPTTFGSGDLNTALLGTIGRYYSTTYATTRHWETVGYATVAATESPPTRPPFARGVRPKER